MKYSEWGRHQRNSPCPRLESLERKLKKPRESPELMELYKTIDLFVATVLVVVSVAAAEPPSRLRPFARQQQQQPGNGPYQPTGWKPQGAAFSLPQRVEQQQQYEPPAPAASYGPPPSAPAGSYGPPPAVEPITTEEPATRNPNSEDNTEEPQAENIKVHSNNKKTSDKLEQNQPQGGSFFVLLPQLSAPQSQSFVYNFQQKSEPLLAVAPPQLANIQALPGVQLPSIPFNVNAYATYVQI